MKRYGILLVGVLMWFGFSGPVFGAEPAYRQAVTFAKAGQDHFAFMHYNKLLRESPSSSHRKEALFGVGEYYFQIRDFTAASAAFTTLLNEFPDADERLYALACLLKITRMEKNESSAQDLEKRIIDLQRSSFVFRESKETAYRSPLYQSYRAVIQIDTIEFYVEGKLFAKVSY